MLTPIFRPLETLRFIISSRPGFSLLAHSCYDQLYPDVDWWVLHTHPPPTSHPCLVFAVSQDKFYPICRDFSFTTPVGRCLCFLQTAFHPSCILGCLVAFPFLNRGTPGPLILCVARSVQLTLLPVAIPVFISLWICRIRRSPFICSSQ